MEQKKYTLGLIERWPLLTLAIFTIVLMLPNLETLPVSIMEARNFVRAREIVDSGNWLLTTMNGLPRYEKPPLPTWITALSGMQFGIKEVWALRLPTVLMTILAAYSVWRIAFLRTSNRQLAIIAGLITISSFYVVGICVEAPIDIYAHSFTLAAISFFIASTLRFRILNLLLAALFLGFSILSKGPVSPYALFLPFAIAFVYSADKSDRIKYSLRLLLVLILGAAAGGWWYAYVRFADPEGFASFASKETSNWVSYNVRPFYYYASFVIQSGLWTVPALVALIIPYLKKKVSNPKIYLEAAIWTLSGVLLLSIIPEKKSRYLLPVLFPLAITISFYIDYLIRNFKNNTTKKENLIAYIGFCLAPIVAVLYPLWAAKFLGGLGDTPLWSFPYPEWATGLLDKLENTSLRAYFGEELELSSFNLYVGGLLILFPLGLWALGRLRARDMKSLFISSVAIYSLIGLFAGPLFINTVGQNRAYELPNNIRQTEQGHRINIVALDYVAPETVWYADKIIPVTDFEGLSNLDYRKGHALLIPQKDFESDPDLPAKIEKRFDYSVTLIETYNTNHGKKQNKRKITRLYLLNPNKKTP